MERSAWPDGVEYWNNQRVMVTGGAGCLGRLLTEFVPLDDPRSREILATQRRDMSWYTLDGFVAALKAVFGQVETFPSHPKGRTLIPCAR